MPRVFKTRQFAKWMRKTDLTDGALCLAVREMQSGLVDADLGGDVLKKRVAFPVAASVAAFALWWRHAEPVVGFLSMVLRRTTRPM
jgi:hypothetical protein